MLDAGPSHPLGPRILLVTAFVACTDDLEPTDAGRSMTCVCVCSAATAFSRRQRPLMTDGAAATTQHFHAGQGRPRQRAQRRRGQAQTNLGMPSNHCGSGLDSWGRGDAVRQGDDSTCCSCCGFDARLDRAFALLHWRDFALACF